MNNGKICVSVCASDVETLDGLTESASEIADLVELRLDCLDRFPNDLSEFNVLPNTIITLRPSEEGGNKNFTLDERRSFWMNFPFLCGGDMEPDVIDVAPSTVRPKICSHHDFSGSFAKFDETYDRLSATNADVIKIAATAPDAVDSLRIWKLLERANSEGKPIIPIAMGEAGKWTRILGLAHRAYLTYAALETGNETAPGQITARDMINVYRVKELDEQTEVYGIIAGDTTYTMSPYIHNAAFKATGRNAVFVPFQVSDLDAFMQRMVLPETREIDLNFRGFSVTIPHKEAVIKHLDVLSETARQTGAVNTIAVVNGKLHGHNTDADGFMSALENSWDNFDERTRFAVVGSGGAARACSFALKGPNLTIIARDLSKAQELAKAFDADAELLTDEKPFDFSRFDVVVNTTPLGTKGTDHDGTIASAEQLRGVKLVYDLVYNPQETRLLCEAKKAGAETLGGFDMLIAQAAHQFKIWTGQNAPVDEMSAAAKKRLYDS